LLNKRHLFDVRSSELLKEKKRLGKELSAKVNDTKKEIDLLRDQIEKKKQDRKTKR
jgi:hypothetical protein